jgi:hypothetical protein
MQSSPTAPRRRSNGLAACGAIVAAAARHLADILLVARAMLGIGSQPSTRTR